MAIRNSAIKALSNKLSKDFIEKLYEDERFTQLAMDKATEYTEDLDMCEDLKMDISFHLLESIRLTSWTDWLYKGPYATITPQAQNKTSL